MRELQIVAFENAEDGPYLPDLARHPYDQAAAEAAGSIFSAFVSIVVDGSVSETPVTLSPLPVGISFRPLPGLD